MFSKKKSMNPLLSFLSFLLTALFSALNLLSATPLAMIALPNLSCASILSIAVDIHENEAERRSAAPV